MAENEFRTVNGYRLQNHRELTEAMEDYLEMICRHAPDGGFVRISQLAAALNVKPSSASKMAVHLRELGYVDFERYGLVVPTAKGLTVGRFLLHRHAVLVEFLQLLNHTKDVLEQAELMEHFFDEKTVENLANLIAKMRTEFQQNGFLSGIFSPKNQ